MPHCSGEDSFAARFLVAAKSVPDGAAGVAASGGSPCCSQLQTTWPTGESGRGLRSGASCKFGMPPKFGI